MSTYNPDKFILISIDGWYLVFCGWGGGYLHGQSWKRSSGILSTKKVNNTYHIKTETGSTYVLPIARIGCTVMMDGLINSSLGNGFDESNFVYDENEIIKIFDKLEEK